MNDSVRQLYQSIIVNHVKAPRHRGPLAGATHAATVDNPLCGDQVTMRLVVEGDLVRAVAFEGQGCALSQAGASLLADRVAGAPVAEARALCDRFTAFVGDLPGAAVPDDLGDLTAFAGVREFRSRQACATLAAAAFAKAIAGARGDGSTEPGGGR